MPTPREQMLHSIQEILTRTQGVIQPNLLGRSISFVPQHYYDMRDLCKDHHLSDEQFCDAVLHHAKAASTRLDRLEEEKGYEHIKTRHALETADFWNMKYYELTGKRPHEVKDKEGEEDLSVPEILLKNKPLDGTSSYRINEGLFRVIGKEGEKKGDE